MGLSIGVGTRVGERGDLCYGGKNRRCWPGVLGSGPGICSNRSRARQSIRRCGLKQVTGLLAAGLLYVGLRWLRGESTLGKVLGVLCILVGIAIGIEALSSAVVGFFGVLLLAVKIVVVCAMCYVGWNWFQQGTLAFRRGACSLSSYVVLEFALSFPFGIELLSATFPRVGHLRALVRRNRRSRGRGGCADSHWHRPDAPLGSGVLSDHPALCKRVFLTLCLAR